MLCSATTKTFAEISIEETYTSLVIPLGVVEYPKDQIDSIQVELDGYDVTELASLTESTAEIQLQVPLTVDRHQLSIIVFLNNGDIETLVDEVVNVIPANGTIKQSWNYNVSFDKSYRFNEKSGIDFESKRKQSNNMAQISGDVSSEHWAVKTDLDMTYNTNTYGDESEYQLPGYRVEVIQKSKLHKLSLSAGTQNFQTNDLLFSNYQRRGVQVNASTAQEKASVALFSLYAAPTTEHDDNYGVSKEKNENVEGGVIRFSPLVSEQQSYTLSASYIKGESQLAGSGLNLLDETTIYGGDSWNVALDSSLLNNFINLHLEHAESTFDDDGINIGMKEKDDEARQAILQLAGDQRFTIPGLDSWGLNYQYVEVGRHFYSLANMYLSGDIQKHQFNLQGTKGDFGVLFEHSTEENNIEDDADIVTQTKTTTGIDASYTPSNLDYESRLWKTVGMPSLTLYWHKMNAEQDDEDAQLAEFDLDTTTDEYNITLNFFYSLADWTIQHTITETDDQSQVVIIDEMEVYTPFSDTRNKLTLLQLNFMPSEFLSIMPMLQWNELEELDTDASYKSFNGGLEAQWYVLPEELFLSLSYGNSRDVSIFNDQFNPDNTYQTESLAMETRWHALKSSNFIPALDVYFKASAGRQNDKTLNQVNSTWQAFIGFTMHWAN